MFHLKEITNKYTTNISNNTLNSLSTSLENENINDKMSSNTNIANKPNIKLQHQRSEPTTALITCQITAFNEAKINKFINSNANDMIMNFDFYINNGRLNLIIL
jgi:hypothetical protein